MPETTFDELQFLFARPERDLIGGFFQDFHKGKCFPAAVFYLLHRRLEMPLFLAPAQCDDLISAGLKRHDGAFLFMDAVRLRVGKKVSAVDIEYGHAVTDAEQNRLQLRFFVLQGLLMQPQGLVDGCQLFICRFEPGLKLLLFADIQNEDIFRHRLAQFVFVYGNDKQHGDSGAVFVINEVLSLIIFRINLHQITGSESLVFFLAIKFADVMPDEFFTASAVHLKKSLVGFQDIVVHILKQKTDIEGIEKFFGFAYPFQIVKVIGLSLSGHRVPPVL